MEGIAKKCDIYKAYRALWTCKGTCKTWGGALYLHPAYQTCTDL
jgi:hypothetical protein